MIGAPDVRASLVTALEADLVGPFYPDAAAGPQDELLTLPPSRWYLTGFLAPQSDRETKDPTADEEFSGPEEDEDEDSAAAEPEPKQKNHFPASMGLSVLLPKPPIDGVDVVRATVTFADYIREEQPTGDGKKRRVGWRRVPSLRAASTSCSRRAPSRRASRCPMRAASSSAASSSPRTRPVSCRARAPFRSSWSTGVLPARRAGRTSSSSFR